MFFFTAPVRSEPDGLILTAAAAAHQQARHRAALRSASLLTSRLLAGIRADRREAG
ncbi:hypothetical protein [Sphingosinicella sp. CPCC 101087]|uniref:hypothetical protein n=1 Tax=Sphingosinicella sp. CPCC 101087 TaxID=2497754 RepID=UPI0019804702|nr:hypothetical protein [Sphingosinicella sp. CPCC 101087]